MSLGDIVPKDTFDSLKTWIHEIDKDSIAMEYKNFVMSFKKLPDWVYVWKNYMMIYYIIYIG